jgi:UDP-glucose/galactose:(glucosyl)LPS alpha-1,2-glucosyl/galactosyltransferase
MAGDPGGTPIVIAIALDGRYAPWAATLIRSCVRSNPSSSMCFEIVHDGTLSKEDCVRLAETATSGHSSVRFHPVVTDEFADLPTTPLFGPIVWLRFRLPDLLLDRSRVIYLDSDTLVMADLQGLWDTALDPHPLAAVANVVEPAARPHVQALGIQYPGGFFNSGVLLMDLDRMRAEQCSEQLLKAAVDLREKLVWPDQDALNLVFARRWFPLHPRWNTQNSFWAWRQWAVEVFGEALLAEATKQPGIRHFEGPGLSKPWHYLCPYPGRKQHRALLAETPWANIPLEDKTAATWFVRLFRGEMRYRAYARLLKARRRIARRAEASVSR